MTAWDLGWLLVAAMLGLTVPARRLLARRHARRLDAALTVRRCGPGTTLSVVKGGRG